MIGDLDWYRREGAKAGTPSPRCPFANTDHCPRYYQSLSLLGEAGFTGLAPQEEKRLSKKWARSALWPKTGEQATSIMSSGQKSSIFSNFCPEVIFDGFGWFATFLSRYADELDLETAHIRLATQHADSSDWRWQWSSMTPMHYSACPLYSVLANQKAATNPSLHDFFIALICNMLASALLWAVPNNLSNVGKSVFVLGLLLLSAYALYFRLLKAAGNLGFWSASVLTLSIMVGLGAMLRVSPPPTRVPVIVNPRNGDEPSQFPKQKGGTNGEATDGSLRINCAGLVYVPNEPIFNPGPLFYGSTPSTTAGICGDLPLVDVRNLSGVDRDARWSANASEHAEGIRAGLNDQIEVYFYLNNGADETDAAANIAHDVFVHGLIQAKSDGVNRIGVIVTSPNGWYVASAAHQYGGDASVTIPVGTYLRVVSGSTNMCMYRSDALELFKSVRTEHGSCKQDRVPVDLPNGIFDKGVKIGHLKPGYIHAVTIETKFVVAPRNTTD